MIGMDYSVGNCSKIVRSTENDFGWNIQWEMAQKQSAALKMIGINYSVGNGSKIVRSTENDWDGLYSGKWLKNSPQH